MGAADVSSPAAPAKRAPTITPVIARPPHIRNPNDDISEIGFDTADSAAKKTAPANDHAEP
jgi:hypothetical protein